MTVSTIGSVAEFVTNGVTTNFPFYFKFLANEDLSVTYVNPLGMVVPLTLGTDYTANGAKDESGGSIVTTIALAGPGQLIVSREMDPYQLTSLRNQGKFLAETHEDVFDRLTMLIQQGFSINSRSLNRPYGKDYYDAEGRRIVNLADPIDDQDATTKHWSREYLTSLIGAIQGPINNAANVFYKGPDNLDYVVQDMSSKTIAAKGAALIGYKGRTVADRLGDIPSVKDFGVVGDGVTDDAPKIQLAVNAGDVHFPPGNYLIKSPILVPSNRKISGSGYSSKITIATDAVGLSTVWAGTLWFAFCNSNIVSSGANSHIEITGLFIDGNGHAQNPFLTHFRNCQYVTIDRCTLKGGGDGTAFTMSQNWKVSNCFAYGQFNCCYDSWENSSEGLYENNIGYVTLGYGMLCTGDTSLNTPGTSANVSFIGNIIIGPGNGDGSVGIWLQSGVNLTSNCYSCRVEGNYVRGFQVAYRSTGGGSHIISGNTATMCPVAGLVLGAEVVGNPSQGNIVNGNIISGCGSAANTPLVVQSGSVNNVIGNNSVSGVLSPYAVLLDSTTSGNTLSNNKLVTGTVGFLSDLGTGNFCSNTPTGFYGSGLFTPTLISSGGGTPTYAAQYGSYQQIGNRVHFNLRISISALGTLAAGNVTVGGLPKLSKNDSTNNISPIACAFNNLNASITVPPVARVLSSNIAVSIFKWSAGSSASALTVSDITATSEINLSGSYVANT